MKGMNPQIFVKPSDRLHCQCCAESASKDIYIRRKFNNGAQGVVIALCDDCIDKLISVLQAEGNDDNG